MEIDTVLFYNQIKLLCICLRLSPVGMKFENEGRGSCWAPRLSNLPTNLNFFRIMCRDQRIQRIVGMPKPMVDDDMGGFLTDQLLQDIFRFSVLGKTTAFFPSRVHKEYFRFPANHPCSIGKIFPHHCMAAVNSAKAFRQFQDSRFCISPAAFFRPKPGNRQET